MYVERFDLYGIVVDPTYKWMNCHIFYLYKYEKVDFIADKYIRF